LKYNANTDSYTNITGKRYRVIPAPDHAITKTSHSFYYCNQTTVVTYSDDYSPSLPMVTDDEIQKILDICHGLRFRYSLKKSECKSTCTTQYSVFKLKECDLINKHFDGCFHNLSRWINLYHEHMEKVMGVCMCPILFKQELKLHINLIKLIDIFNLKKACRRLSSIIADSKSVEGCLPVIISSMDDQVQAHIIAEMKSKCDELLKLEATDCRSGKFSPYAELHYQVDCAASCNIKAICQRSKQKVGGGNIFFSENHDVIAELQRVSENITINLTHLLKLYDQVLSGYAVKFTPRILELINSFISNIDIIQDSRKKYLNNLVSFIKGKAAAGKKAKICFISKPNSRINHVAQLCAKVASEYFGVDSVSVFSGETGTSTVFDTKTTCCLQRAGFEVRTVHTEKGICEKVRYLECGTEEILYPKMYDDNSNPIRNFAAVMVCAKDSNRPVSGAEVCLTIPYNYPESYYGTKEEDAKYDNTVKKIGGDMFYILSMV